MFNSIFRKQLAAYISTLILGFAALGFVLTGMFQNYITNQKIHEMKIQCKRISDSFIRTYGGFFVTRGNVLQFREDLELVYEYTGASFFVLDHNARIFANTVDIKPADIVMSKEIEPVMLGNDVVLTGNLDGIFKENVLTVGYPIKYDDGKVYGAVFMNIPMSELTGTTRGVIRITLICISASAAVSLVLIYYLSRTISKPIHEVSEAAKIIADGSFGKRLKITGRDEVGQLARSFNEMAESLDSQERQRREFIANISHDLRSPLTSMRGFLSAILDGTIPPERHDRYINIVLDESERLSKLADDIMEISKIASLDIPLNRTVFDINELIRKTVIMFEPRIIQKGLEMNVIFASDRTDVYADSEKIQRAVYNLLDNAVKFTDAGCISAETKVIGENVTVCIKDTGIGIPPEDKKRVFDRFYKADASRGEDRKGSGLGLSIVSEFIKAHGKSITVSSEPGKGCEFVFTLPLA